MPRPLSTLVSVSHPATTYKLVRQDFVYLTGWKSLQNLYKITTELWWENNKFKLIFSQTEVMPKGLDSKSVMEKLSKWATTMDTAEWDLMRVLELRSSPGLHHLVPLPYGPRGVRSDQLGEKCLTNHQDQRTTTKMPLVLLYKITMESERYFFYDAQPPEQRWH